LNCGNSIIATNMQLGSDNNPLTGDVTEFGFIGGLHSLHTTKTAGLSHAREHGELYYGVA